MICSICKRPKEIEYATTENSYCADCWSVVSSSYDYLTGQGREYLSRNSNFD